MLKKILPISILNEKGLLPSLDLQNNKIESVDDLANIFKSEIETQAKNYILEKIGEEGYNALEKGITLQEFQQYEDSIQTLDTITDDVMKNISRSFRRQSFKTFKENN